MKISEQGFTERLPGQTSQTGAVGANSGNATSTQAGRQPYSDNLQLSSLASRLQNTSASDASRTARLNQIAQAVRSNSYQVNPAQISSSMISESLASLGR